MMAMKIPVELAMALASSSAARTARLPITLPALATVSTAQDAHHVFACLADDNRLPNITLIDPTSAFMCSQDY